MAQRYGGKYSPTPPPGSPPPASGPLPHRFDGKRPSPAGGRVNMLFVASLLMLIPAFTGGPDALFKGLGATLLLLAAAAGIPRARYDACLAAKPGMDRLMAIRSDAVQTHKLQGTPSFLINGKMQTDVFDWTSLEPLLTAAVSAAPKRTK